MDGLGEDYINTLKILLSNLCLKVLGWAICVCNIYHNIRISKIIELRIVACTEIQYFWHYSQKRHKTKNIFIFVFNVLEFINIKMLE